MILNQDRADNPLETGAISAVMREIASLPGHLDEDGLHAVREVAAGVQAFLAHDTSAEMASTHVRALTSRALISCGRKDLAIRLLLVGGGVVKTAQTLLVDYGETFVLDLKQLVMKREEYLDLVFRKCLLGVVDAMAHMWDEVDGCGMLGLRNSRAAAGVVLGAGAHPVKVNRLARETKVLCEERLAALRQRRGWKHSPVVCELDWMTKAGKR